MNTPHPKLVPVFHPAQLANAGISRANLTSPPARSPLFVSKIKIQDKINPDSTFLNFYSTFPTPHSPFASLTSSPLTMTYNTGELIDRSNSTARRKSLAASVSSSAPKKAHSFAPQAPTATTGPSKARSSAAGKSITSKAPP